ncbi:MAG TPA: tRNA glutamyl-Q(34) synthetase GluQRS [Rudaea sp.]|nr:tRNA glutamyl-Q(34) synthetase GluQRS [Rudaea sp.]
MTYRGRFAPSPTGPLHFGSLVAALGSWLRARAEGGTWLVRIEDLDPPREMPGAAAEILVTLAAFGLESDEPVLYQSTREGAYARAFAALESIGTVFPCWCSRAELAATGGLHPSPCIAAPDPARAPAWRLRVPDEEIAFDDALLGRQVQNLRRDVGDFVIRRVEGWYAYQLAVVVDDAAQGITEVVRGADLLDSTPRQIHLQRLLGYPTPAYLHLPLVLDAEGRKLSKQDRARPVDAREPVPALRAALAFLGLPRSPATRVDALLARAIADFDVARLTRDSRPASENNDA